MTTKTPLVDPLQDGISRFAVIDHMGCDALIARSAWVDDPEHEREATYEDFERIIRYMMRHEHTSPYYHPQVCMYFKMPIFVLRQADRHQIGFNWPRNEESRRYKDNEQSPFQFYNPKEWRGRSKSRKQGSDGTIELNGLSIGIVGVSMRDPVLIYEYLISLGVAPEMARIVLPVSLYTSFYATASLWAILHFLNLRTSEHAQWEIRQYAFAMEQAVRELFPLTYDAWKTYQGEQDDARQAYANRNR